MKNMRFNIYILLIGVAIFLAGCNKEQSESTSAAISSNQVTLAKIPDIEPNAKPGREKSEAALSPDETTEQNYLTESYDVGEGVFMSEYMKEIDAEFQETVIEEGILYEGEVVYVQSDRGLLSTGDAALDAQNAGDFIIDVLESGNVEKYSSLFGSEQYFNEFRGLIWNRLDTGWTANRYYDCYYTYVTEEIGYVSFTYYIYPDYEQMQAEKENHCH